MTRRRSLSSLRRASVAPDPHPTVAYIAPLLSAIMTIAIAAPANASDATAPRATIVVNEFAAASSASDADSFFELRNVTTSPVDLTGWSIFRCDERGLRENAGRPEVSLTGVVLAPGEIFLATQMSARIAPDAVDSRFSQAYAQSGLGLVLVGPDGKTVDAVAMYPNMPWPTQSECAPTPNLPASLAAALDESWQRTDAGSWVRATATAGRANAQAADTVSSSAVRIEEVAAAGPGVLTTTSSSCATAAIATSTFRAGCCIDAPRPAR